MADVASGSELLQFLTSLRLVKDEVNNSLELAINQLDLYAEHKNQEYFVAFLEQVQLLRGTFKMIGFRPGERLCEEVAETSRVIRNQANQDSALQTFTQALFYLQRYLDCAANEDPIAASLLIPAINAVRKERNETMLPEAYFFITNLRPQIQAPKSEIVKENMPLRKIRQLFQLGLLGLLRKKGQKGPVQLMARSISRFENMSRGTPAWLFWNVATGAMESLAQPEFEMTTQRLRLLRVLDIQIKKVQDNEAKAFLEKTPDWMLKEFLYLVALAEPETELLAGLHKTFHLKNVVREKKLAKTRAALRGPDQSAMESLSKALHEEMQSIKDLVDLFERTGIDENNFGELQASLGKIADIFSIANLADAAEQTRSLNSNIQKAGIATLKNDLVNVADQIIQIEQQMLALAHGKLDEGALVDPVSLKEARVAVILESMAALGMIKRAIGSYVESDNDKMHIANIGKTLVDIAGAFFFLEERRAYKVALDLSQFVIKEVVESALTPNKNQIEAFADVISALEFYLDSLQVNASGAKEALQLAVDSIAQLRA